MNSWDMTTLTGIRGKDIYSSDGEKIGAVKDIFYDENTRTPEWVGVGTGFLGMKERVIPVETLVPEGDHYRTPFTRDRVKEEPDFETTDDRMRDADDQRLTGYFGLVNHTAHMTRVLRSERTTCPSRSIRGNKEGDHLVSLLCLVPECSRVRPNSQRPGSWMGPKARLRAWPSE